MKISDHGRTQFSLITQKYKEAIESIQDNEQKEMKNLSADSSNHKTRFDLAEGCLKIASYYNIMSP